MDDGSRGLVVEDEPRVSEQGAPVRPTEMFSLDAIAAASARRPAFSAGWSPASGSFDDRLRPVEHDVPIDVHATNEIGRTPLMEANGAGGASAASRLALVSALIEHGADVNATDTMETTALMVASDKGHVEVMTRLIAAGSAVNAQARHGRTALMEAAQALDNTVESVSVLLQAGADKSIRDEYGRTAVNKIARIPIRSCECSST